MGLDQDKKVLNELNETLVQAQTAEAEKLPKEHLSDFSTDSMTYLDISAAILDQTENLFLVTGECNRFAPEYLTYCKTLITAVNHLGSAFITKTAMHCRDYPTQQIETLTVERLNQMLSFNFRKCNAALTEIQEKKQEFALDYFHMLLSFDTAMQRLRATQKRSVQMLLGLISPDTIASNAHSSSPKDGSRNLMKRYCKDAPFRESPAYAVRYDALKEAEKQLPAEAGKELPAKTPEEPAKTPVEEALQPESVPETPEEPAVLTADSIVEADEVLNQSPAASDDAQDETPAEAPGSENSCRAPGDGSGITVPLNEQEAPAEEEIKFAVDFDQIDTRFVDQRLEWKVLDMIDQYPQQAWQEIFDHLQDPIYCKMYPEYVKIFVKIIKKKMAAAAKDEKT